MKEQTRKVVICGGVRIPFARSFGKYMGVENLKLVTAAMQGLVGRFHLHNKVMGEVALGAVMKHARDWNMAREATLSSGLDPRTPAYDVQQACGTSLETCILIGNKIALGQIECGIAAGTDTNSDLPIEFNDTFTQSMLRSNKGKSIWEKAKPFLTMGPGAFKPVFPAVVEPRTGLSMGHSTELMAQNWGISREAQDELAYQSHKNAAKAYDEGFFNDLVIPFGDLERDDNLRADTSIEKLAKLKPAYDKKSGKGTLTAGNSTPLTDGASAVLLASEDYAKANDLPILAYLFDGQTAAVDFVKDEGLLMAPAYAVPQMLKRNNLTLQDFDYYEIHEAFAAQVLCTLKAWEDEKFCKEKLGLSKALGSIDRKKLNVKGSSLAVGHPFAATGGRIVATLAKLLNEKGSGRGLISVCTAGGMGVVAILEK